MSANQLFHVPGVGDFPLEKVELIEERVAKHKKKNTHTNSKNSVNTINDLEMGETRQETLETFVSTRKRESRHSRKQTAERRGIRRRRSRREVTTPEMGRSGEEENEMRLKPKGWSDYQVGLGS